MRQRRVLASLASPVLSVIASLLLLSVAWPQFAYGGEDSRAASKPGLYARRKPPQTLELARALLDSQDSPRGKLLSGSSLDTIGPALCTHPTDEFRSRCLDPSSSCPFKLAEVRHCKLPGTVCRHRDATDGFSGIYATTRTPFSFPEPLVPAWYFIPLTVRTMLEAEAHKACAGQQTISVPVVYATRDEPTLWHVIAVQLLPMFAALRTFGLEDEPFKVIFIDGKQGFSGDRRWTHGFRQLYNHLSGSEVEELPEMPEVFCTGTALVGASEHVLPLHIHRRTYASEVTQEQYQLVQDYVGWMLRKHDVNHTALSPARILLTIIVRPPREDRGRLLRNPKEVVAWAQGWGEMGLEVQMLNLGGLSVKQQLQAMAGTSILLAVHGAALTWLAWLPAGAVVVELKPYKHTDAYSHFDIYSNWALLAHVSHIVWHNNDAKHTSIGSQFVDDYKNHNIYLPEKETITILAAALDLLKTPMSERAYLNGSVYLNEPTPVDFREHLNMG